MAGRNSEVKDGTHAPSADAAAAAANGRPLLLPKHLKDLRSSGLSDAQISACRFYSEKAPGRVSDILRWGKPASKLGHCLVIPFLGPDGEPTGYARVKPDYPRKDSVGKPVKYESPVGLPNSAYFPPHTRAALAEAGAPLLLTEGEKKAASADQEGFACVGLVGVWGWTKKKEDDRPRELIDDLGAVAWEGREVFLVFDSDLATNPNVRWAEYHLAQALGEKGATVKVVRLPAGEGGAKVGLDDFLVKHGPEALRGLLAQAIDPQRPTNATRGDTSHDWPDVIPLGSSPSVPTFPAWVLPPWQREWVLAQAEALQVPADLPGMLCLAIAGAALATKFRVIIRDRWAEPLNLLTVVALPPGERKSAAFAEALKPVMDFEAEEQVRRADEIEAAAIDHRTLNERLKRAERAIRDAIPEERHRLRAEALNIARELAGHQVPARPQLWCDDATPEALAEMMFEQGERILVASAEGAAFEICKGRYCDKGKGPNFEVWLKGHAGDTLRVNRVKRGNKDKEALPPIRLEQPALSAAMAVQPDVLQSLSDQKAMGPRGFLARWLYSLPVRLVGSRKVSPAAVPQTVALDYQNGMLKLWRLPGTTNEAGRPGPHWLKFSPQADLAMQDFERWLEPQLAEGEELHYLRGFANKLGGSAARIAAIWHVSEAVETGASRAEPVSAVTVQSAIKLARDYLLPHARAAFGLMGANRRVEDARHVLRWLRANSAGSAHCAQGGPRLSKRDIFNGCRGRWPTVAELEPVLELLEKHGYLRPLPQQEKTGPGRRPSPEYLINPHWLDSEETDTHTHNAHNPQNSAEGVETW
jgi:hypothetical protein